jgi:hypothetical protein
MQFDRAKFKDLVHYICHYCDPSQLGAVKLHKVLYFSDMLYYAATGAPITGAQYVKSQFGPTAASLLPAIRELEQEVRVKVRVTEHFGFRKREYTSTQAPDRSRFNAAELACVDEVIDFVCRNNTARSISEFSHTRAWELAKPGEVLPYFTVFHMFPNEVSSETLEWAESEAREFEAAKAGGREIPRRSYRDFRAANRQA